MQHFIRTAKMIVSWYCDIRMNAIVVKDSICFLYNNICSFMRPCCTYMYGLLPREKKIPKFDWIYCMVCTALLPVTQLLAHVSQLFLAQYYHGFSSACQAFIWKVYHSMGLAYLSCSCSVLPGRLWQVLDLWLNDSATKHQINSSLLRQELNPLRAVPYISLVEVYTKLMLYQNET